jgi:hypothetical protein
MRCLVAADTHAHRLPSAGWKPGADFDSPPSMWSPMASRAALRQVEACWGVTCVMRGCSRCFSSSTMPATAASASWCAAPTITVQVSRVMTSKMGDS